MTDEVLALKALSPIESLPRVLQEDALVPWQTVAVVFGSKDVEHTREKFTERAIELGEKLVRTGARRRLPRLRTVRKVMASFEQ
jgi:hypothetical protein